MKFEINFLDLPTHDLPKLDAYRHALLNFDEHAWYESATGGAGFVAQEPGLPAWSLALNPQKGHGISLLVTARNPGKKFGVELASVGDAAKMDEFVTTGQQVVVPLGSFVTPEHALWAIEDFCADPATPSARVRWLPTSVLEYPLGEC